MKKSDWIMALFVILLTLIITLVCVVPVFAQDDDGETLYTCKDPKSMSYVGKEVIKEWESYGFTVKHDPSQCEYLYCEVVYIADDGFEVVSCDNGTPDNGNYNEMFSWAFNQNLAPDETAYFEPIDIEGCTDPLALNWMDPFWWEGFNIIEDGSCYYEPEESIILTSSALEWN